MLRNERDGDVHESTETPCNNTTTTTGTGLRYQVHTTDSAKPPEQLLQISVARVWTNVGHAQCARVVAVAEGRACGALTPAGCDVGASLVATACTILTLCVQLHASCFLCNGASSGSRAGAVVNRFWGGGQLHNTRINGSHTHTRLSAQKVFCGRFLAMAAF